MTTRTIDVTGLSELVDSGPRPLPGSDHIAQVEGTSETPIASADTAAAISAGKAGAMTVDPHVQDPGSAPITEVVVVRNGVEILRQPCESEQEAADIIAHWEEQPGVECAVVDLTTGREEGSADIDWTDPAIDYPAGRDDFGVEEG